MSIEHKTATPSRYSGLYVLPAVVSYVNAGSVEDNTELPLDSPQWAVLHDKVFSERKDLPIYKDFQDFIGATTGSGYEGWLTAGLDEDGFRFDRVSRQLCTLELITGAPLRQCPPCFPQMLSLPGVAGMLLLDTEDGVPSSPTDGANSHEIFLPCHAEKVFWHSLAEDAVFCFEEAVINALPSAIAQSRAADESKIERLFVAPDLSLFLHKNRYFGWILENSSQHIAEGLSEGVYYKPDANTMDAVWQLHWIVSTRNPDEQDAEAFYALWDTLPESAPAEAPVLTALIEWLDGWFGE